MNYDRKPSLSLARYLSFLALINFFSIKNVLYYKYYMYDKDQQQEMQKRPDVSIIDRSRSKNGFWQKRIKLK